MKYFLPPLLLVLTLFISACASLSQSEQTLPAPAFFSTATLLPPTIAPTRINTPIITPTPTDDPDTLALLFPNQGGASELTRIDNQGMVVVEVTPLNLGKPADNLEFEISLNTHSVDLSMDLAYLATLTTDTGIIIQATLWDAPRGGHHVGGKLFFPIVTDGARLLDGATKLILQIRDVDVPVRTFEWELK
ncbi:MAG: hypothetical protein L6461_22085 [Anaerolineae bacterium]|nr:hypothetical protein [Anaerolineae bacterium]